MEQEYISFQALLIFILVNLGSSDRIHNKIYFDMHNKTACVRLLNGTHQIGCQSSERGNVGVVHLIENVDDVEWLRSTGPHSPYVAVVTSDFYNLKSLKALKDSGKVNGVLVIPSNVTHPSPPANGSSPEYSCPNEGYGMYGKEDGDGYSDCNVTTWNPVGDAMNFWDWSIPIFLLDNVMDIRSLLECYKRHNEPSEDGEARDWPLCAAELGDRMFAAIDSVTCIRRTKLSQSLVRFGSGHCDPLGDKNVWATLRPVTKSNPPAAKSIVVAAAREAFDYIGSSRMVHDMEAGRFPSPLVDRLASQTALINLTHISHIVEVSQVARIHAGELWLHSDPRMRKNAEVNRTVSELVELLRGHALEVNLKAQEPALKQPLPPASAQRFLRNSSNIPTVVIADHEAEYRNKCVRVQRRRAQSLSISVSQSFTLAISPS
ncbi:PREDICTED: nicastrin-like [Priapulus caudatus]|uniref:Nicastrin n=1 Tax=Priapulus caudatus TaxID=37621 RepID=A0ABM1EM27_PRICU|nr:PREDICTED: nicastrin-like [Priapulus caudatus]